MIIYIGMQSLFYLSLQNLGLHVVLKSKKKKNVLIKEELSKLH